MPRDELEYEPKALLEEVAGREALTLGTALLVLVRREPDGQRVVRVERLESCVSPGAYEEACDEMRSRIDRWSVPDDVPPTHSGVVVHVREGLCVLGRDDVGWLNAWRYTNHLKRMYSSNLIIVTEHGWLDFATRLAGSTPALARD